MFVNCFNQEFSSKKKLENNTRDLSNFEKHGFNYVSVQKNKLAIPKKCKKQGNFGHKIAPQYNMGDFLHILIDAAGRDFLLMIFLN
jgi:hypothetical protein